MRKHFHQLVNSLPRSWRAATIVGICALALATALAGCGGTTSAAAPTPTTAPVAATSTPAAPAATATPASQQGGGSAVSIVSFAFSPATLTVKAGTTVTWTNTASIAHTSTSDSGSAVSWDSGTMNPNGTFKFTFSQAGTYTYHCAIHPNMQAKIIVTA